MSHTKWLEWAKKIHSISQNGLTFSKDVFDIERYEELQRLSAEILNEYTELEFEEIINLYKLDKGYQTPKIDVRGAVFQDGKILLVREKNDNKWSLPGGFCDTGLSPSENIVKEIAEESGYEVRTQKLLAVFDMNKHAHPPQPYHYYKLFILCSITGGHAKIGLETKEINFFSENNLPSLSISRNTESQIKTLFEFLKDPLKETLFD